MTKKSIKKGFSLVELLVVITIIAILSVTAYVALGGQTTKAKDARRKQDLASIQQALEIYFAEYGKYPKSTELYTDTNFAKKMSTIPKDPGTANNKYRYAVNNESSPSKYELSATLEGEGDLIQYQAYVMGNCQASNKCTLTDSSSKYYKTVASPVLDGCATTKAIVSGAIAQSGSQYSADGTSTATCVPYDPNTAAS